MIVRDDIRGGPQPHRAAVKYLAAKGGSNIYAEPNYRLVWAPSRVRLHGGRFQDWAEGTSLADRGGMLRTGAGVLVPSGARPLRVVEELRETRAYQFEAGWVLERWVPNLMYGPPERWQAIVLPGTQIPLLGPYPEHGDYEMCHYEPSLEHPSISELQRAIDRCERGRDNHREQTEQVLLERANQYAWEYEQQMAKEQEALRLYLLDDMKDLLLTTAGMGRHRTELAERAGVREHVGN